MKFDKKFFQKFDFDPASIEQYLHNAKRDLNIAKKDEFVEVRFTYAYQALIKSGIVLLAATHKVKVRGIPGHHIKIIDKTAEILDDENISLIGHVMRKRRNLDMYSGGEFISTKEVDRYYSFVEKVLERVEKLIKSVQ